MKRKVRVTYLGRVDLLEVLDNTDNTIGDLRLVKEGALHVVGEEPAGQGVEGERQKRSSGGSDGSGVDPQMLEESASESHGCRREESETLGGVGEGEGPEVQQRLCSAAPLQNGAAAATLFFSFFLFGFVGLYFKPMARLVSM